MNLNKYVEETNAAFEVASAEQKRVMIAEDVIARLDAKNIEARRGDLVYLETLRFNRLEEFFKDRINEAQNCQVCAKGAILCSYIGRVNKLSVGDTKKWSNDVVDLGTKDDRVHTRLIEVFSITQIDIIEAAFEGSSFLHTASDIELERAENFALEYHNADERLRAIMNNIIKNNGTFIP